MKITDSVVIHAPPQRVWQAIVDPATWPVWNSKVVSVVRTSPGPLEVGETFNADFKLRGPVLPSQIKVRVLNPLRQLTVKQRPEGRHRSRNVKIDFEMATEGAATRVTQTTDLTEAGLPFFARWFMWFVTRFGKAAGPSPLDGLKKHLEGGVAKAPANDGVPAEPAPPAAAETKKTW